jgi:RNA polymerase sigma-70 factor, ECF subfamily
VTFAVALAPVNRSWRSVIQASSRPAASGRRDASGRAAVVWRYDRGRAVTHPQPPDNKETVDLVDRFHAGADGAFDDLYRRYRDEMLLAVRLGMGRQLRAALQSEDVMQSVVMQAFQAMPRFQVREPGGLRAFLHRLVRHKLVDHARALRAKKRAGTTALTASQADAIAEPAPPTYSDPRYAVLERALADLPDDMRAVVRLRRFEGLSSQEVAARLHKSDDAVRKLYSRAIARLSVLASAP